MFSYLLKLKKFGFEPKYILDIGANTGIWNKTFQHHFPNTYIKSFEANPYCENFLKEKNIDYKITLLGDKNQKNIPFYTLKNDVITTGASIYKEETSFYDENNYTKIYLDMYRLDEILDNKKIDLVKIDVQGAELNILSGMTNILNNIDFIILEVSLMRYNKDTPLFSEVIKFMDNINFKVFNIMETNYINDICFQCDILFLNTKSEYTTKIAKINTDTTFWKIDNLFK